MLEMRAACEHCGKALPHDGDARICSYECMHLLPRLHQRAERPLPQLRRRAPPAAPPHPCCVVTGAKRTPEQIPDQAAGLRVRARRAAITLSCRYGQAEPPASPILAA